MWNIQPLIEGNLFWEKKIPHQEIIIVNKTICATIIGTPRNYYLKKCNWSMSSIYILLFKVGQSV